MSIKDTQDTRKTCSTIFLLPGIGLRRKDILQYGFLSAYIDDLNHPAHYGDAVYLLFRAEDKVSMNRLQEFLTSERNRTDLLVEDYDYEGGYVVAVYRFDPEFKEEYKNFLKGKYSKFRKKYTDLFPREVEIVDEKGDRKLQFSLQYHIFNRTDAIRKFWEDKTGEKLDGDTEMWSSPYLNTKEILDINNL